MFENIIKNSKNLINIKIYISRLLKLSTCFFIIFNTVLYSSQIHVDINHSVYNYLDRMSTKGFLPYYRNATLPLSISEVNNYLIKISITENKISTIDKKMLEEYMLLFLDEYSKDAYLFKINDSSLFSFNKQLNLKETFQKIFLYNNLNPKTHLSIYEKNNNKVWFDIGLMSRFYNKSSLNSLFYSYYYSLSIILDDKLFIYSDADLYSLLYNKSFPDYPNEFKGGFPLEHPGFYGYKYEKSFEYANAYFKYYSKFGSFALRKEPIVWGNGHSPIILSDNVPSFPMLSWDKKIGNSYFTFFHGSIKPATSDTMINGLILSEKKYLVGHRWELWLTEKLQLGLTEMLVYGGRDAELVYFLPTIFLWPIQHNMTSQSEDNILWFFEGRYLIKDDYQLYGTFMIDELNTKQIFNNYIGNRWVSQFGINISKTMFSFPIDIIFEVTSARPWAYTHRVPIYGTYTHNGRSLGFKYGPNTKLLTLKSNVQINNRNYIVINYEKLKFGEAPLEDLNGNYEFGNNVNHNYQNANVVKYADDTGWIIGNIKTTTSLYIAWDYKLSNALNIQLGTNYEKNSEHIINTMTFQLDINY